MQLSCNLTLKKRAVNKLPFYWFTVTLNDKNTIKYLNRIYEVCGNCLRIAKIMFLDIIIDVWKGIRAMEQNKYLDFNLRFQKSGHIFPLVFRLHLIEP